MLDELRTLVEHESPSRDVAALNSLRLKLNQRLRGLFPYVRSIKDGPAAGHVSAVYNPWSESPPLLILGHFDTVWPIGSLASRPFRVEGDKAFGPGTYDMKASLVILFTALEALCQLDDRPIPPYARRSAEIFLTSDEEIGSPDSRMRIEKLASNAAAVLVLEPPLPDGSLKTARKGVGGYTIEARGRSAHAGIEPEKGANAIAELAHQVLKVQSLNDLSIGTTLNVGTIEGGTTANVVPDRASCRVDVRASTLAEAARIDATLRGIMPVTPGTTLHVSGGFNRPPMERSPGIASLFEKARKIGRTLGMELTEGSTGGGSDANFTAALGVPTLDGLGALGGGAHAEDEHVLIDSIPERAALLAALLMNL